MPGLPTSDIELARAACVDAGITPIESFTDDSDEAVGIDKFYELVVQSCLTEKPWPFAQITVQLARTAIVPKDTFNSVYAYPATPMLRIKTVRIEDRPIVYRQMTDGLHMDADEDDVVIADYTGRVPVAKWPPMFTSYAQLSLAARIAKSLKSSTEDAEFLMGAAGAQLAKFGHITASGETNKRRPRGRILAVRWGSRAI